MSAVIAADVFLAGLPPIVVLVPVIGHDQDDLDDDDVHTPIGDQLQLLPPKTPGAPRKTPFQRDT